LRRFRSFLGLTGPLAVLLLGGCSASSPASNPPSAAAERAGNPADAAQSTCSTQVIVSLAPGTRNPPEDDLVKDIGRKAGVNLVYLRSVTPELLVFSLTAAGDDCDRAVGRLRSDPRVRSVDIDRRRQHH